MHYNPDYITFIVYFFFLFQLKSYYKILTNQNLTAEMTKWQIIWNNVHVPLHLYTPTDTLQHEPEVLDIPSRYDYFSYEWKVLKRFIIKNLLDSKLKLEMNTRVKLSSSISLHSSLRGLYVILSHCQPSVVFASLLRFNLYHLQDVESQIWRTFPFNISCTIFLDLLRSILEYSTLNVLFSKLLARLWGLFPGLGINICN